MNIEKPFYTISSAAQEMGVEISTLHKWITYGWLKIQKRRSIYFISGKELEKFRSDYKDGKYNESCLRQTDTPEDIQICLHCTVPVKCIPSSPDCGLRKKGKIDTLDRY